MAAIAVRRAVLRADGSAEIGLGHVMRSLALGEALAERGWQVTLAAGALPANVVSSAQAHTIEVLRLRSCTGGADDASEVAALEPDVVVVDGYGFSPAFFATLIDSGCAHAVIDDNGETPARGALAIINQNPHAAADMYAHLRGRALLLLGLDYVLLRSEVSCIERRPHSETKQKVFLAMGGSDPLRLTAPLAEGLDEIGLEVHVAIGSANAEREEVAARVAGLERARLVPHEQFAPALAESGVAVIGAGTTMWEAAYLGVPALALVVAANQILAARTATSLGFARALDPRPPRSLGPVFDTVERLIGDGARRTVMAEAGQAMIDGNGVHRVADVLEGHTQSGGSHP